MEHVSVDLVYKEIKQLHKEVEKTQCMLLSILPEVKVSKREMNKLKGIKKEMDSGKQIIYSKKLF